MLKFIARRTQNNIIKNTNVLKRNGLKESIRKDKRFFSHLTLPLNNSDTNNSETAQQILKSFGGAQVAPAQSIRGLTKFYKNATHMHDDNENTWLIQLDDKPVRTPRKNIIKTPNEELAFAIAQEWDNQKTSVYWGGIGDIGRAEREESRTGPEQRSPNTEQAFTEQPNHEQRTEHEHEHEQRTRT